jgi:hypothetical protein
MVDTKLLILLVVCVTFMVYLSVEGFAAYQSYSQMLAAKYGTLNTKTGSAMSDADLVSKYSAMNLSGSALQNAIDSAKQWQNYNINPNNDLYKKLRGNLVTTDDIRSLIGSGDKGKTPNKSWLTYYDATDYSPNSSDIVRTASGSFLQKRTGSRLNETSYIDTMYFNEDSSGGKMLTQCRSDDFNCIRNLSYSDPNYQPVQGDTSWLSQFGGAAQTQTPTNSAGFPIPAPVGGSNAAPAGGSNAAPARGSTANKTVVDCIIDCLNKYGGSLTQERIRACSLLCTSSST